MNQREKKKQKKIKNRLVNCDLEDLMGWSGEGKSITGNIYIFHLRRIVLVSMRVTAAI